jgi:translation initiation factor 2 alpha subunit (eIF-2alpha)
MDKVDGNEDGFIDLSKKTVLPEDIVKKKATYEKCKIVHLIMK